MLGFGLWTIANALTVQLGARSSVLGGIAYADEWIILIVFAVIALLGLIMILKNVWTKSDY